MSKNARMRGVTLIELMIAVAVVAILAAVAYPSYNNHLTKSRRAAAQVALSDMAQRQQQFLLDNRAYAEDLTALRYVTPGEVAAHYTLSTAVVPGPPPSFIVTATPHPGSRQAADGDLTLASDGTRTPAGKW